MSTVTKKIADDVINGKYPEDGWLRVIEYVNAWGGISYGLENKNTLGKYKPSEFVINPKVYWEKPKL